MTRLEPIQPPATHEPYKFSERDYLLLSKHGAFDGLAKAELIEGVIVAVNAQYSRHVRTQTGLFRALAAACDRLGSGVEAWIEGSISIDGASMPQPDIFLSRGLPDDGPIPASRLALVVEIADSSLKMDIETKARLYATAGIAEYWVADVNARLLYQHWSPTTQGYGERRQLAFGATVHAATIEGLTIETGGL